MDGLDLAACTFTKSAIGWSFTLHSAETCPYPTSLEQALISAPTQSAQELAFTANQFGQFVGQNIKSFATEKGFDADFIGLHGHTVFHQPEAGLTLQIGGWPEVAAITMLPVVGDFRTQDVALGGQGAPLVPIGDALLFSEFDFCLNLGGIANISFESHGNRVAYDICPANMILNELAAERGLSFDEDGKLAATGKADQDLLSALNELPFYREKGPKSLGREWYESDFRPLIQAASHLSTEDKLATVSLHIAAQIANCIPAASQGKLLATGGGAFNQQLITDISQHPQAKDIDVIVAESEIVSFKEALIFGFLATLRWREEANCLASVTGARHDHSGGAIYLPQKA